MMKKILLVFSGAIYTLSIFSQNAQINETNVSDDNRAVGTFTKSGQQILPAAGDVAIGIDATPFFKYLGNSFNGNTDNDNTDFFSFKDDVFDAPAIYIKYFITDESALRIKTHIGFSSKTDKTYVDDLTSSDEDDKVENKVTRKTNGIGIRGGYEFRRGYGRLQGFFGPEVGLGLFSTSTKYEYGNSLRDIKEYTGYTESRTTQRTSGTTITGLLGGFAGVEYFIAPKISIGGELGLALKFSSTGDGKISTETLNDNDKIKSKSEKTGGSSTSEFATRYNGNIYVMFHF